MDNEECEIGAKCISVPLIDYTGKVVAAISISGPVFRMTDEKVEKIKEYMLRMSKEISKKLAYTK
jgi:DNA-binding IclR family transcriptional regulator